MKLSVKVARLVPRVVPTFDAFGEFAADLERWGAAQVVIGEHLFVGRNMEHPGGQAMPGGRDWLDPFVALAAMSATTTSLRLSTGALVASLRNPLMLAKAAATLDVISGGRFDLGIAAGWYEPEFAAVGVPFDERFARLDETLDVCRAAWRGDSAYRGRWTSFDDVEVLPRPLGESVPLWIGGRPTSASALRVARFGDGWIASDTASTDDIARGIEMVRAAALFRRRDPAALAFRALLRYGADGPAAAGSRTVSGVDQARVLAAAGVTHVTLPLAERVDSRAHAEHLVRELVEQLETVES